MSSIDPSSDFVFFTRMCDELVLMKDSEDLIEEIKWIEEQATKQGKTTYEIIFDVLYKHKKKQESN